MAIETFQVRLVETRDLSPWVKHLVFERTDGPPIVFAPGQWFNLFAARGTEELKRAYSIASAPDGSARIDLTVTRVPGGPMSELLHGLALAVAIQNAPLVVAAGIAHRKANQEPVELAFRQGVSSFELERILRGDDQEGTRQW